MKDIIIKIKDWWISIPRKTVVGKLLHLLVLAFNWIFKWSGKFSKWIYASEMLSIVLSVVIFKRVTAFGGTIMFLLSCYLLIIAIYRTETR